VGAELVQSAGSWDLKPPATAVGEGELWLLAANS
jgi:hypothetical protein